jgi:hypothetical protein
LIWELGLEPGEAPEQLEGVGGSFRSVTVETRLRIPRSEGGYTFINATLAAATEPDTLSMSVLGRDLLNLFAVIIDKNANRVCLLYPSDRYTINEP